MARRLKRKIEGICPNTGLQIGSDEYYAYLDGKHIREKADEYSTHGRENARIGIIQRMCYEPILWPARLNDYYMKGIDSIDNNKSTGT